MSETNDGGPAFPTAIELGESYAKVIQPGMSLRDWFAGQALAGDMAAQGDVLGEWLNDVNDEHINYRAVFFYRFADAMIAAREKGGAA